jgi:hypothetical protein
MRLYCVPRVFIFYFSFGNFFKDYFYKNGLCVCVCIYIYIYIYIYNGVHLNVNLELFKIT